MSLLSNPTLQWSHQTLRNKFHTDFNDRAIAELQVLGRGAGLSFEGVALEYVTVSQWNWVIDEIMSQVRLINRISSERPDDILLPYRPEWERQVKPLITLLRRVGFSYENLNKLTREISA